MPTLPSGKDNYAADRAEASRLIGVFPLLPVRARQNRLFLATAVTWLAGQGVRQFVDIGCGLPTAQNTHQVAQAAHPDCRVAYVDRDPVVVSHARALLSGTGVIALQGDLADPDAILADPALEGLITLAEPVAVILAMVLHFLDAATACGITAAITRAIAPGSYVVISAGSGDEQTGGRLAREYQAGTLYNHFPGPDRGVLRRAGPDPAGPDRRHGLAPRAGRAAAVPLARRAHPGRRRPQARRRLTPPLPPSAADHAAHALPGPRTVTGTTPEPWRSPSTRSSSASPSPG